MERLYFKINLNREGLFNMQNIGAKKIKIDDSIKM